MKCTDKMGRAAGSTSPHRLQDACAAALCGAEGCTAASKAPPPCTRLVAAWSMHAATGGARR
jgi:hypothetical protein